MTGPDQAAGAAPLLAAIRRHGPLAIAVSGGVDSMVLAFLAHRFSGHLVEAFHAVSPAVPAAATERVRRHAERHGWNLRLIDAKELADPSYRANPVDRCYFCKTNLYARVRAATALPIGSGTNTDDLGDYRPGLRAAAEHGVVHPYVEAGVSKAGIYALAAAYELDDLASLPAQPCLASRVETGIGVDADSLAFIEAVEVALAPYLPGASALRCRVTAEGVRVECAPMPNPHAAQALAARAADLCSDAGRPFIGVQPYRKGAAFLVSASA